MQLVGHLTDSRRSHATTRTRPARAELLIKLIFGGHETTANLIGNTLMQLVPPAEDARRWTHTTEEVAAAVEETLRHDPPVQGIYRRVVADTEVGEARIPAGAQVFALIGAANRDGDVFTEQDKWDRHRDAPKHLAFGQGVHYCLGAQLAKMEARSSHHHAGRAAAGPVVRPRLHRRLPPQPDAPRASAPAGAVANAVLTDVPW